MTKQTRVGRFRRSMVPASWSCGAIDGTSHRIYKPQTEPQEEFYSGHRRYHSMHTQVIVDNIKKIRLIRSGYMGHLNDAATFVLLPVNGRC